MINTYYFSNEIVFAGHPDKVCDQISDAILTKYLKQDPDSRCGIEVMGTHDTVYVSGEITSKAEGIVIEDIVNEVLKNNKYPEAKVVNNLNTQSADIALGVDAGGAGDQGMMFGYACDETPQMLPLAQVILQRFALAYDMFAHTEDSLYTDGKAQITGEYDCMTHRLLRIKDFTISYANDEENREVMDEVIKTMAKQICDEYRIPIETFHINPTGKFSIWGFEADTGLTGRKIVCDSYHSFAPVGGGAFSGKDPTKVDRSAAYYARYIAKQLLKAFPSTHSISIQISYTIGMNQPMAICVKSADGETHDLKEIIGGWETIWNEAIPNNIINFFNLKEFDYTLTSKFGHFGFNEFPWENK